MSEHSGSAPSSPNPPADPASSAAPAQPQAAGPQLADAQPAIPRAPWRIWLAMAVGSAVALPVGWILALVAPLPGELGLFFFLVAGMLIGAGLYRLAAPAAPIPRPRLYVTTAVVALSLWSACLVAEYRALPQIVLNPRSSLRRSINFVLPPDRREEVEDQVRRHIYATLKSDYPPGGFIGYLRWAATSGAMDLPRVIDNTPVPFQLSQRKSWWIVRVLLSLVFTASAVLSQLFELGPRPPAEPEPSGTGPAEV